MHPLELRTLLRRTSGMAITEVVISGAIVLGLILGSQQLTKLYTRSVLQTAARGELEDVRAYILRNFSCERTVGTYLSECNAATSAPAWIPLRGASCNKPVGNSTSSFEHYQKKYIFRASCRKPADTTYDPYEVTVQFAYANSATVGDFAKDPITGETSTFKDLFKAPLQCGPSAIQVHARSGLYFIKYTPVQWFATSFDDYDGINPSNTTDTYQGLCSGFGYPQVLNGMQPSSSYGSPKDNWVLSFPKGSQTDWQIVNAKDSPYKDQVLMADNAFVQCGRQWSANACASK